MFQGVGIVNIHGENFVTVVIGKQAHLVFIMLHWIIMQQHHPLSQRLRVQLVKERTLLRLVLWQTISIEKTLPLRPDEDVDEEYYSDHYIHP